MSTGFVQSLERGLLIIKAFTREQPRLTLTEAARLTGLTRATARRLLLTLEYLGYVRLNGRDFELTPRVLELGYAYLASFDLATLAGNEMEELVKRANEPCSIAVLDGLEIVYVARVPVSPSPARFMLISLGIGSRLPAYCTSMGRVLLAALPEEEVLSLLSGKELPKLTSYTKTDPNALLEELALARDQGWAMIDQEREIGVRSIAAPLVDSRGRTIAALNLSTNAGMIDIPTLLTDYLPQLLATAAVIDERLAAKLV